MASPVEMVSVTGITAQPKRQESAPRSQPGEAYRVDRDAYVLAKSGKTQVLKRRFGLFSMTGLACATMISWEGNIVNLGLGLANGGPAGLIWGTLLTWIGTLSVFVCMGELSSMSPTAGGQYHWASILAPKPWRRLLSYITGWVTVATWVAAPTAVSYLTSTMTLSLINVMIPTFEPQPYQGTLLMWAVLALSIICNTVLGNLLPAIELAFLVLHVIGFFAILIPILALGPRGNAAELFTNFNDSGGWGSAGLSFLVGIQGAASAILGTDCVIHMSEETRNAEVNAPRAMVMAVFINGSLTFIITIVILYVAGPISALLASDSQYPFINIIMTATGSRAATAALVGYIIFMNFAATVSTVSAGGRMVWSFARDRGLPQWRLISKVEKRFTVPMVAIGVVSTCAALLGIIQIGSTVAFEDVTSLVIEGFFSSYLCVLLPLLYHRVKGNIREPDANSSRSDSVIAHVARPDKSGIDEDSDHSQERLKEGAGEALRVWGPFHLKGWLGIATNAFACTYLVFIGFFSFWPPTKDVDAVSMNYSSLILGGIAILSFIYYTLWARKTYTGPIVEVEI